MAPVQLSDMNKPAGESTEHRLTYYDGSSRIVYTTGNELPYPDGKLIVSRVDLEGNITHANEAFVDISGYAMDELVGKPHIYCVILICQKLRLKTCGIRSRLVISGMAMSKTCVKMAAIIGCMPR